MNSSLIILALILAMAVPVRAAEREAIAISQNIQQRHLPDGVILDPIFAAPDSDQIVGYAHGGDSAIWTGHYLAAEAFRYRVTGSPEALLNVKKAIAGIGLLMEVTGNGLLARCALPADAAYAQSVIDEEQRHGLYRRTLSKREYVWFGNTSRDQYSGVFFGLGAAYDLVDDAGTRSEISALVSALLDYLLDNDWFVRMPDGAISTTFVGHPDQRLSFLAVGRRVNEKRFDSVYSAQRFLNYLTVGAGIVADVVNDHDHYFKFNLDTINLYNLIRLEGSDFYRERYENAYNVLRRTTDDHGNAHFNMIDRALKGPDARRDAETRDLLEQWLRRPRRDEWLDWRNDARYPACGEDRACNPIAIVDRVRSDFLWQRSPFLLFGGGNGTIEAAGIDYILPYWMARYYGVIRERGENQPTRRGDTITRRRVVRGEPLP
jgi:hypothetical protein